MISAAIPLWRLCTEELCHRILERNKKNTFWRQFNEKPSNAITPGCPEHTRFSAVLSFLGGLLA